MEGKQFIRAIGLAVAGCVALGGANAQVTEADVGVNPTFEQTGPTMVTSTGGFFSGRAFVTRACLQFRRMAAQARWTAARKILASLS
jgi:hypothetical protein